MGVFDALNAKVLAAIDRRSGVSPITGVALVDGRLRLTLGNDRALDLAWAALRRVVALRRDVYGGDLVSLLLEFDEGQIIEVASSVPGWTALSESIDLLDGSRRFGEWHAEALAAPPATAIAVWSHGGVDGSGYSRGGR